VKDSSGETMTIDCQLLIKSIGYQSVPVQGVPWDCKTNTIPNEFGCVTDENG
jgi:hypothetical protein